MPESCSSTAAVTTTSASEGRRPWSVTTLGSIPPRRRSRSSRSAMLTTIWMCTHEWSDMCSRSALACCMYHHALSWVSALAFAIRRSSDALRSLGARIDIAAIAWSSVSRSSGGGSEDSAMAGKLAAARGERIAVDTARLYVDRRRQPAPALARDVLDHRRPHVQLDLLGHQQAVVHDRRQPVAAAGPGDDLKDDAIAAPRRPPLDLPGLQMTAERAEPERIGAALDHADGAVPRAQHAHEELVAPRHPPVGALRLLEAGERERSHPVRVGAEALDQVLRRALRVADEARVGAVEERACPVPRLLGVVERHVLGPGRRAVLLDRPVQLAAVDRRDPPDVAPAREEAAERRGQHRTGALAQIGTHRQADGNPTPVRGTR